MPVHSNSRSCRLGRRPVTQGPRNQSSNQGWTEKLATERKIRASKDILSVGTWNVRTLWAAGKLQLLQEEMRRYRCDILGISEMRWTQSGELEGGKIIWSGHEHNHKEGVGFILSNKAKRALLGYKPVNERIPIARFQAQPFNIAAIQQEASRWQRTNYIGQNATRCGKRHARADKEKWLDKQCREIEKYHAEFKTREVYKTTRNVNRK